MKVIQLQTKWFEGWGDREGIWITWNEKSCSRATVKILNNELIEVSNEHIHLPEPVLLNAAKFKSEIKRRTETTTKRTSNFISQSIANQNRFAIDCSQGTYYSMTTPTGQRLTYYLLFLRRMMFFCEIPHKN